MAQDGSFDRSCLSDYSCILNKGEKWKLHCTELVSKHVQKLVDEDKEISVVAIGPNEYFAVVCTDGTTRYHGPKDFNLAMQEINTKSIKSISFGSDYAFTITTNKGHVHHNFSADKSFSRVIAKHWGRIDYATLSASGQWIVGFGQFGFIPSEYLECDFLIGSLNAFSDAKCAVHNVVIGNDNAWAVLHEMGITARNMPSSLWKWVEKQEKKIKIKNMCIAMYDRRPKNCQCNTDSNGDYQSITFCSNASLNTQLKEVKEENKLLKAKIRSMQELNDDHGQNKPRKKKRKLNRNNSNDVLSDVNFDILSDKQLVELEDGYKMKLIEINDARKKLRKEFKQNYASALITNITRSSRSNADISILKTVTPVLN